jgi:predicted small lipoprotein YifL
MKMTIQKLVVVAVSCTLLGCGREHPGTLEIKTHPEAKQPPQMTMTFDELTNFLAGLNQTNFLAVLNPPNCTVKEIVIWKNAAGNQAIVITRDGGVCFRYKF